MFILISPLSHSLHKVRETLNVGLTLGERDIYTQEAGNQEQASVSLHLRAVQSPCPVYSIIGLPQNQRLEFLGILKYTSSSPKKAFLQFILKKEEESYRIHI